MSKRHPVKDKQIYKWHEGITAHSRLTGTLQLIETGVPKSPPSPPGISVLPGRHAFTWDPTFLGGSVSARGQKTRLDSRGLDLGTRGRMLMGNFKESILMEIMSFEKWSHGSFLTYWWMKFSSYTKVSVARWVLNENWRLIVCLQ